MGDGERLPVGVRSLAGSLCVSMVRLSLAVDTRITVADFFGSQGLGSRHVKPLGLGTGRGDLLADCSAVSYWVVALCDGFA